MLERLKQWMGTRTPSEVDPRSTGREREGRERPVVEDHPPEHRPGMALDTPEILQVVLSDEEQALLAEIERRVASGRVELPQLPPTSLAVMDLSKDPTSEITEIAARIAADPMLSSRLVRIANSALYASVEPIVSIHDGVMRLGLRAVRTLVLSASMQGLAARTRGLGRVSREVWLQALSVARIARALAPFVAPGGADEGDDGPATRCEPDGIDRDLAFHLGLLHDVGKFPLLAMLDRLDRGRGRVGPALIAQVFHRFHEPVGRALAERWRFAERLRSVAGCHHRPAENADHPTCAALCALAHAIDLNLSLGDVEGFAALAHGDAMELLGIPEERRGAALEAARQAYGRRAAPRAA